MPSTVVAGESAAATRRAEEVEPLSSKAHDCVVVTNNERDFEGTETLNPLRRNS